MNLFLAPPTFSNCLYGVATYNYTHHNFIIFIALLGPIPAQKALLQRNTHIMILLFLLHYMDQFERRYNTIVIMICMYGGDMMSEYEFIIIAKMLKSLFFIKFVLCPEKIVQTMTDCSMRLYYL